LRSKLQRLFPQKLEILDDDQDSDNDNDDDPDNPTGTNSTTSKSPASTTAHVAPIIKAILRKYF